MAQFLPQNGQVGVGRTATSADVDAGLRSYMLSVYNYMVGGVLLTGLIAFAVFSMAVVPGSALGKATAFTDFGKLLFLSPLKWVVMFAPLAFILVLSFREHKMSAGAAQMFFWAFAAVMGVSMASIFIIFKIGSIAQAFVITAAAFAALSVYGYTTKKDLSGMQSFLIMGAVGLMLASVVNLFLQSSALMFAINVICVLVFGALTAFRTQSLKDEYYAVAYDGQLVAKSAIMGALDLYLYFVNMFQAILSLFGDRE